MDVMIDSSIVVPGDLVGSVNTILTSIQLLGEEILEGNVLKKSIF